MNLLEGGDIQKTASNGLFQVFSETGPFQDPILQISKPGYKPFHLQIERNKEETRYMIKSEQVFVEYDTPVYPDLNNRKTFSAGTWINKWSQDFKNGDTLSIYLEREDIKTEVDRLVRKQNTFNR
ncbi:hypothetical protein GCM10011405_17600 [Rufibacter glacialis]|nr:hypothetical protein GCM10011405_17600 [Rufibacter glacialis]